MANKEDTSSLLTPLSDMEKQTLRQIANARSPCSGVSCRHCPFAKTENRRYTGVFSSNGSCIDMAVAICGAKNMQAAASIWLSHQMIDRVLLGEDIDMFQP